MMYLLPFYYPLNNAIDQQNIIHTNKDLPQSCLPEQKCSWYYYMFGDHPYGRWAGKQSGLGEPTAAQGMSA